MPLGTVFTEIDRINPSKNDFGNPYNNTENRNTETEYTDFFWFGNGITPIKTENTELPYRKYRNGKIPKLPKNNTENTNLKMTESKYAKITKINYTSFDSIDNPNFYFKCLKLLVPFF